MRCRGEASASRPDPTAGWPLRVGGGLHLCIRWNVSQVTTPETAVAFLLLRAQPTGLVDPRLSAARPGPRITTAAGDRRARAERSSPHRGDSRGAGYPAPVTEQTRDIADVPSVEVISTAALHLMSAAAVHLGLAEDLPEHRDHDEARSLIEALAGLVVAAAPRLGHHHALPLRDGLRTLQLAFRETSEVPDEPGQGPGESLTGPVDPRTS